MKLKTILSIIKYLVALVLLWLVFSQLDTESLLESISRTNPIWLLAAFGFFTLAQIASVLRMNLYYKSMDKPIGFGFSLRLHYVALFYNMLVPGGVGGDGYRIYILKKQNGYGVKDGIKIQLATRLNGLLILLLSMFFAAMFLAPVFIWWLMAAAVITVVGYMLIIPNFLALSRAMEWRAIPYSIIVQGGNLFAAAAILTALGNTNDYIAYLMLFQAAAIAGMIPISIGGLGLREFTFLYGAGLINGYLAVPIQAETGVTLSLLFFAITLLQSLPGIKWLSYFGKVKS